jgi:hypothetical protein
MNATGTTSTSRFIIPYNIEINISYDTGTQAGVSSCIVNSMEDILLGEFANNTAYDTFKMTYMSANPIPIYIINESFYLDKRSLDAIRKTTRRFPPHNTDGNRPQIRQFNENYGDFNTNPNISQREKNSLVPIFKAAFLDAYKPGGVDPRVFTSTRSIIQSHTTLDGLFGDANFKDAINGNGRAREAQVIGTRDFHDYITRYYDRTANSSEKILLEKFYKMSDNILSDKFKYEYFLNPNNVKSIYKFISSYNSADDSRYALNTNEEKERIYNKYFKYVFPNKKDISFLSDPDKDKILMFYNVFYIVQNIYLYDDTIIQVPSFKVKKRNNPNNPNKKEKYYISNVRLLDLKDDNIHFEIVENKVIIFISATLKHIVENPTLQINYLIDDLENPEQQFSQRFSILQPKDINPKYSIYNKINIHNDVKYIKNDLNIDKLYKYTLNKKYIENKEEVFLNLKTLALFEDFLTSYNKGAAQTTKNLNVESNIKFLFHKIFKFYNNKKIKNYYIKDTYIKYVDNSPDYYSIAKGTLKDSSEKYKIILDLYKSSSVASAAVVGAVPGAQAIVPGAPAPPAVVGAVPGAPAVVPAAPSASAAQASPAAAPAVVPAASAAPAAQAAPAAAPAAAQAAQAAPTGPGLLFAEVASPDARLANNIIYKVAVVFRCYFDIDGNKPSFMRKVIAETCLPRAQILDDAFSNILYKTFDLPKNYLHDKLSNITKKKKVIEQKNTTKEVAKKTETSTNIVSNVSSNVPIKKPTVVGGQSLIKRRTIRRRKYYSSI